MLTVAAEIFRSGTRCFAACVANLVATRKQLLESCVVCLSLAERSGQPRGYARDRTCRTAEFACRARDQDAAEGAKSKREKIGCEQNQVHPTVPKNLRRHRPGNSGREQRVQKECPLCVPSSYGSHCVSRMKSAVTKHQDVAHILFRLHDRGIAGGWSLRFIYSWRLLSITPSTLSFGQCCALLVSMISRSMPISLCIHTNIFPPYFTSLCLSSAHRPVFGYELLHAGRDVDAIYTRATRSSDVPPSTVFKDVKPSTHCSRIFCHPHSLRGSSAIHT